MVALGRAVDVHAVAHITGGGLPGNLPRALPAACHAVLHRSRWDVPAIFGEIQGAGQISDDEMARVFNLGLGMIAVVAPADEHRAVDSLRSAGVGVARVGEVVAGRGQVRLVAPE
jgi:phosphoribosylformylglycinamidine cyclo-ligase